MLIIIKQVWDQFQSDTKEEGRELVVRELLPTTSQHSAVIEMLKGRIYVYRSDTIITAQYTKEPIWHAQLSDVYRSVHTLTAGIVSLKICRNLSRQIFGRTKFSRAQLVGFGTPGTYDQAVDRAHKPLGPTLC
ncbi:hypothetical protein EVAR_33475_1 [Eumeta japonica]|uniref:Uncharacterized protein n=1 Tax=Eumeta variegata TaxID=151549 RepID=A0A4C1WF13_EUMVA|nr:hypothetical protein EVAR_33475_1 [Eumeta japonica]